MGMAQESIKSDSQSLIISKCFILVWLANYRSKYQSSSPHASDVHMLKLLSNTNIIYITIYMYI